MRTVLGIDPGIIGGWAIVSDAGELIGCGDLPTSGDSKHKMVDAPLLRSIIDQYEPTDAVIELVSAMPKQGVSSSFKFGRATGVVEGVIGSMLIPTHWVSAAKWKKHFRLSSDKEASRQSVIRRWPGAAASHFSRKKDHGRAEAALLALYAIESEIVRAAIAGDPDSDGDWGTSRPAMMGA